MQSQQSKSGNWRLLVLGALGVLVAVIVLQNSQQVSVKVLTASFNAPLIVVLLVAGAVGALIGYAAPVLLRHRRGEKASAKGLKEKN